MFRPVVAGMLVAATCEDLSPLVSAYRKQREKVERILGDYKFYVYSGGAFDAATHDLVRSPRRMRRKSFVVEEEKAEVWVHRALLASRRRTLDPSEAEIFFVPAYLRLASSRPQLVEAMLANVTSSPWFKRREGSDHVFGYSSTNPQVASQLGMEKISAALPRAFRGAFEINPAWVKIGRHFPLDRVIAMPYVVRADYFIHNAATLEAEKSIEIFFTADERPHAVEWGNCSRARARELSHIPDSVISVSSTAKVSPEEFAKNMGRSRYCLVMCGDTPTSRRIYDAIVASCVPLIVGKERLEGKCVPPCKRGWGWYVSGPEHPHLPFGDVYVDYDVFPSVDELEFYQNPVKAVQASYISSQRHRHLIAYMREIADDVIYGYGALFHEEEGGDGQRRRYGRAAENLIDTAILRLRSVEVPKPRFVVGRRR